MHLTNEQRIEIILMAEWGSSRMVAQNFDRKHGTSITHNTVAKFMCKLRKLEMLQINHKVVQDVGPPMKTHQLRYLPHLYGVHKPRQLNGVSGKDRGHKSS